MGGRLKFYGWGREYGFNEAKREQLFGFLANRLGVAPRLTAAPRVSDISLRPPRLAPPARLAHLFTSDLYERLLHTYGKSYPETVQAGGLLHQTSALPADESDVSAVLDWAAGPRSRYPFRVRLLGSAASADRRRQICRRRQP
jgi:alkyldihydroxyacetonephosphate synthase